MGKRIRLSNGRRLVDDVIRIARKTPLAALSGDFDVELIGRLRRRTRPRISWNVIYMKAYAQVCRACPELRRAYVTFPYGHLYEHPEPVCMITVGREHEGEERLFFARFSKPDHFSLAELQAQLDHFRKAPVEEIKQFRHQIRFAQTPAWIRRFAWWATFNLWPEKRATQMGTFGMSFSGHNGAYGSQHLGPNTTTLGIDPLPRRGTSRLMLTFDHRVMDGVPATRVLKQLHRMLQTAIKEELAVMVGADPETGAFPDSRAA